MHNVLVSLGVLFAPCTARSLLSGWVGVGPSVAGADLSYPLCLKNESIGCGKG